MKKLLSAATLVGALTFALFTACDPDKSDPVITGNIQNVFDALEFSGETYSFSVAAGANISSQKGSVLSIPPNALVDKSGQTVTGIVNLELLEILKKGDIIRMNRPTVASNVELLESGGEVFVGITQNGEKLRLAPGKRLEMFLRNSETLPNMTVFYGQDDTDGRFSWEQSGSLLGANSIEFTDSAGNFTVGYQFFSDSLDWINCDRFYGIPANEKTSVIVELPDDFSNQNTAVFLVLNNSNSVVPLYGGEGQFSNIFSSLNIPLGEEITVLAVAEKGTQLAHFLDHKTATVTANVGIKLDPKAVDLQEVLDFLEGL